MLARIRADRAGRRRARADELCKQETRTTTRLGVYRACDAAGMVAGVDGMRMPVIEFEASVVTCRIAPSPACMNK